MSGVGCREETRAQIQATAWCRLWVGPVRGWSWLSLRAGIVRLCDPHCGALCARLDCVPGAPSREMQLGMGPLSRDDVHIEPPHLPGAWAQASMQRNVPGLWYKSRSPSSTPEPPARLLRSRDIRCA